ncbi:TetR/AcrR family transcriptional regulator [Mycolicibacterium wolinskyi]|uniref:TetR family transcriptional regulator n=1 Tax=Mycolicibacterium wolinskyi TaxID=59750 RepID=A0A1X2FBV0_9MYCO|nr:MULTISPECIES: TetR/AcrR family transcriptional regulator [Mycolicibacterium]MCV7283803.1 TetR/AcrR family transcriptional regulator [Mycolicibacterium wolinskyi]MCV7297237.1 TetR/AcrR family transcriptional regulator [Mycolicibacterium goodii]ORX15920.1 TetR family transcriptional regulator [Mycolicibacterium wolinskyi]
MPKLWNDTIESHRRNVRQSILDAAAALVSEVGLRAVTMAQVAEQAGIGRATLYKYFPDVETILHAWHDRQVDEHLHQLQQIRDGSGPQRLDAVLTAYARIVHQRRGHDTALVQLLHPSHHVIVAHDRLCNLVRGLIEESAGTPAVRDDVDAGELARYCLHALNAAATVTTDDELQRLVCLVTDGLRPRA